MAFLPFKGIVVTISTSITAALNAVGININYGYYMIGGFVMAILFLLLCLFLLLVVYRVDTKPLKNLDLTKMESMQNLKITRKQTWSLVCTLLSVLYTLIGLVLPKTWGFTAFFNSIGLWLWAGFMLVVLALVKVDGAPVVNPDALLSKVMWGVALPTAAFTVIGSMLSSNDLGVKAWIATVLSPIFTKMSFPVYILVIAALATIVTNFFSNMATGMIIGTVVAPFAVTYCETLGINGTFIALALVSACMFAFLTMAAAGPAPLLLAQDSFVKKPSFIWKYGTPVMIAGIAANWVVCTVFALVF